jgi:hypothetical protein
MVTNSKNQPSKECQPTGCLLNYQAYHTHTFVDISGFLSVLGLKIGEGASAVVEFGPVVRR